MQNLSPNKDRYLIGTADTDVLAGLNFFSLKNSRGSFVIPSTKNFVANYQIKKIKCDDGSTVTILPIESLAMLSELLERYSKNCFFVINELRSIAGVTMGLTICEANLNEIFEFRIGLDVYPFVKKVRCDLLPKFDAAAAEIVESVSTNNVDCPIDATNCSQYECYKKVSRINFFLCSEDMNFLIERLNDNKFTELLVNQQYIKPYPFNVERRNSALLGSDFLRESGVGIIFGRVRFYFDIKRHKLENCTWASFTRIVELIIAKRYLKQGAVDFELLDSIEPNDILGMIGEEGEMYDDYQKDV
jgi:hypothetical protein